MYRQRTSALPSSKSQGATSTTSFSLIQTRRFILPLILPRRTLPSTHFTTTWSPPSILVTLPNSSPSCGTTSSLRFASLSTFLFPNLCAPTSIFLQFFHHFSTTNSQAFFAVQWQDFLGAPDIKSVRREIVGEASSFLL